MYGGAVYSILSRTNLTACTFTNNSAFSTAQIGYTTTAVYAYGGALYLQ
jgi:hypothetical protein